MEGPETQDRQDPAIQGRHGGLGRREETESRTMRGTHRTPEENLLLAVFATRIKDYLVGIRNLTKHNAPHHRSALVWIKDHDDSLFGFDSLCGYFEIDPSRMRQQILAVKTPKDVDEIQRRLKTGRFLPGKTWPPQMEKPGRRQ